MKKVLIILSMFLCLFVTGCTKYKTYTELSYTEFQSKIEGKDTFVIVIGSSTCSACAMYRPTMEEVIKDKQIEIFYLDLNSLTDDEYSQLYSKYVITSTPTTLFIKEGSEISVHNRFVGSTGYSTIVDSLKKYGYLGD